MSPYKNIIVESEVSKKVLKSIIENTKIDYKKLKISHLQQKILKLKKNYGVKKKTYEGSLKYKYEILWNIVEEKYNKKINLVPRKQTKKNKNYNIIYSDFANVLGFLPSLLTLLIYDKEIKDLIKYENFFKDLQISGDFDHISSEQKISFIQKIQKGNISIVTALCPDYEHVYIGMGLYKYTFNQLNDGLGLIGKRLVKIIKEIHKVLKNHDVSFLHYAYYGDFEAYSNSICNRVGSTEKEFIKKLLISSKKMKKKLPEINHVDLLVKSLSSKKKWIESCKINKVKIYQLIKKDKFFKNGIHEILSSRMELYKSWYPDLNEEKYLDLLVSQGAEYASMGDLYNKKLKNPIVFGLDHPKMAVFYNLNIDIPVLYGKPKYL
tara:strand:+ start:156 stop:1292 length:1137 start_codon:yes stop_codon:yes gene_type:complete